LEVVMLFRGPVRSCAVVVAVVVWAVSAAPPACPAQEPLDLPEGVIHVALPPGTVEMDCVFKKGKPFLRVKVDKTVVVARNVFFGDGKHATEYEATEEGGICWLSAKGKRGFTVIGEMITEPGSATVVMDGDYLAVKQLKPGSVYVTTPSIKFEFHPADKPKPKP
jgi:hypothetical protein